MTSQTTIAEVAKQLRERLTEEQVTVEYPGVIHVNNEGEGSLTIYGNADDTWGIDVYFDASDLRSVSDSAQTKVSRDSEDVDAIVRGYFDACEQIVGHESAEDDAIKDENRKALLRAFDGFYSAAAVLFNASVTANETISEGYPFAEDFETVLLQIAEWNQKQRKLLEIK